MKKNKKYPQKKCNKCGKNGIVTQISNSYNRFKDYESNVPKGEYDNVKTLFLLEWCVHCGNIKSMSPIKQKPLINKKVKLKNVGVFDLKLIKYRNKYKPSLKRLHNKSLYHKQSDRKTYNDIDIEQALIVLYDDHDLIMLKPKKSNKNEFIKFKLPPDKGRKFCTDVLKLKIIEVVKKDDFNII